MAIVVFQHVKEEGSGRLGQVLAEYGHRLLTVKLFAGQPVPADLDGVDGVIAMGGPMNVGQTDAYAWLADEMSYLMDAHMAGLPVVGVCLGAQLLAAAREGMVRPMKSPEVGWHDVRLAFPGTIDPVMAGIPWSSPQFHLHGQHVADLPEGATPLASSEACKTQAFRLGLKTYGFQYHFEWDKSDIATFSKDRLVEKTGTTAADIAVGTERYYDAYRRLGDRLCHNLATLLFPIDKR